MAEVYRARGKGADGTEYFYAVKRILPEYTRDPEIKKMFIEESRVAACLVHPSVVRVYDLATADNEELYIVMEFLEGKDLSEAIEDAEKKKQPLPIWFAIQIARDVLRALHYVTHEATDKNGRTLGLIHRDISPHNIFVCFDGQVKLTDFGVAKVQESNVKTQVGITKGKLGYMSPEQLMGSPLDFRSDLYNVGILLFESITGRQLFQGATTAEFLQAMVRGIVPPMSPSLQVPPELENLIRRSLDRDRTKRPETALAFERELAAIAERYNLVAQPAHVAHQMRELFGKVEPPALVKPATAPQKLRSMMLQALDPAVAPPAQAMAQAPVAQAPGGQAQPYHPAPVQAVPAAQPYQPAPIPQPAAQQPYQPYQPAPIPQPAQAQQQPYQPAQAPLPPRQPAPTPAASPSTSQSGGYQSPYARAQTVTPAVQAPSAPVIDDDDFATIVRPPDPESMSPAPRVAATSRPSPVRPPSRPNQRLADVVPSQPRVQVAVSQRMRTLPPDQDALGAPPPTSTDGQGDTATVEVSPAMVEAALRASSQSGARRPSTMARGNARPLESLPPPTRAPAPSSASASSSANVPSETGNWGEDQPEIGDHTRIEPNPPSRPTPSAPRREPARPEPSGPVPSRPVPNTASGNANRPSTVQVGSGVGARSKKVVPLDDR